MSTMIFTRGLPGSGKSTWAKEWISNTNDEDTFRYEVNRDTIRNSMGIIGKGDATQEEAVTIMQRSQIDMAIDNGFDVVVSDTNLRVRFVKEIIEKAIISGYDVEFKDFPMQLDDLFKRNKNRPDNERVDEQVIRDMHMKFPYKKWQSMETLITAVKEKMDNNNVVSDTEPFINNPDKPKAILVDIDGTIAHKTNERDWHDYDERIMTDTPDYEIIDMVNTYYDKGYHIIVMSGRQAKCMDFTKQWLFDHNVKYHDIHMRETNDNRADWIVKDELVRAHVENQYYISFCLDDRNQVVNHYRKNGFKVLQVAEGNF